MEEKYLLIIKNGNEEKELKFCKLTDIGDYLNIPIHICRKIVQLTEKRHNNIKPHYRNKEIYDNIFIKEIPRKIKNI